MQITRAMKAERLAEIEALLARQQAIIFTNYHGLKALEVDQVRLTVESARSKYLVTKNTLLRLALQKAGYTLDSNAFDQPLACVFGFDDQVVTAKAVVKAAKELEALEILGGIIDGALVSEAVIRNLATLPGRQELLAKLVGTLAAPLSGLVAVLSGNIRALVSVLHQYEQQKSKV